jgi:ankyrin repeat protein
MGEYEFFDQMPNFNKMMDLIYRGANPCAENNHHWTIWHYAARFNRLDLVKKLVQMIEINPGREYLKIYLNKKNDSGRTPLHVAILNNSKETAEFLIFNGASLNAKDGMGWTPLHVAALRGNLFIVRKLLEVVQYYWLNLLPTYVNLLDNLHQTPLDCADGKTGVLNPDVIRELRRYGAKTAKKLELECRYMIRRAKELGKAYF